MPLLLALVLAQAIAPGAGSTDRAIREAEDLIVFGKLENLDFEALDEWGMDGRATARLRITRVERGRAPSKLLKIRYIAHSYLSEDGEFRFHLRRPNDGTYLVCGDGSRGYLCR